MHLYIEILFCIFLAVLGTLMIRKLRALKINKKSHIKRSYVEEKYRNMLSRKISFRFMVLLFTLALIITISILIEKGMMIVTW
ncbi:hypothetical protein [Pedobacter mendelii]|uniref:hypothetical protein n=1 Tax=Pedobacter mendelii TaxID=1908240 RepID=UPI00166BB77B|nr:hypothetical protein [Pedobacter mendelii]